MSSNKWAFGETWLLQVSSPLPCKWCGLIDYCVFGTPVSIIVEWRIIAACVVPYARCV